MTDLNSREREAQLIRERDNYIEICTERLARAKRAEDRSKAVEAENLKLRAEPHEFKARAERAEAALANHGPLREGMTLAVRLIESLIGPYKYDENKAAFEAKLAGLRALLAAREDLTKAHPHCSASMESDPAATAEKLAEPER